MDPLAHKYPGISPYAYVGNNPLIFIDPDGRDRRLIYNQSDKTITVRATYYHNIGSTGTAIAGIRVFNNMKGMTYTDSEGTTWSVRFQLDRKRSRSSREAASVDPQGNSIDWKDNVVNNDGRRVAGLSINQKFLEVDTRFGSELTPAHEIGHSLGMGHSETGIMTESSNDPNRSGSLEQKNINQMIEQGIGPVEHTTSFWDRIKNFFGQ